MKKSIGVSLAVLAVLFFGTEAAAAEDFLNAEEKALQAHKLALSDVIYEQENFKALYYQNVQIIQLLKEIREELSRLNTRQAQEAQTT